MNRSEKVSTCQSPLQFLAAGAVATNRVVGLADLSLLEEWGVKGPGAGSWLAERGVEVPQSIYASRPLPEGGLVVRVGSDEFFLEAGQLDQSLASLGESVPASADFTPVLREDAIKLFLPASQASAVESCRNLPAKSSSTACGSIRATRFISERRCCRLQAN